MVPDTVGFLDHRRWSDGYWLEHLRGTLTVVRRGLVPRCFFFGVYIFVDAVLVNMFHPIRIQADGNCNARF